MKDGILKWCIRGYDGLEEFYNCKIPYTHISEKQLKEVLKRLVARHLTEQEIITSSLNKRVKSKTQLLEIQEDSKNGHLMCGSNPYYTATLKRYPIDRN